MIRIICICMTSPHQHDHNHHHVCHVNEHQEGKTALMYASDKGHKDIVKLLEDKMASSSSSDNWICAVFGALGNSFHHLCTRLADLPKCIEDTCNKDIDKKFDDAGKEIMKDATHVETHLHVSCTLQ